MPGQQKIEKGNEQPDDAKQLQLYQQKIANILESFTDAFFEVDKNWIVTYWNKEAERLLLMSRADILGKNLWSVYRDAVPLKFYSEYHRAVNDNVAVRFEEYFEPLKIWVEVAAFPSGESLSVYFKDITSRKEAQRLLELEKQRYHDLFNLSPIPQWVYDVQTLRFIQVNEAAIDKYGYSRNEFLEMTVRDISADEEQEILDQLMQTVLKSPHCKQSVVKHRKKSGEVLFVEIEGNTVSFEGRDACLVLAIDLTEKIEAQKELELSLDRYDIVSKATSDSIWDWDLKSGEMTWNKGIQEVFGYNGLHFNFEWWESNVHPDDIAHVREQFSTLVSSKSPKHQVEYRFRDADGKYRTVLDRSFILFDADGQATRIIGSMQDISKRIEDMKAIELQNKRLREISWIQSHKVRAPLARIMGLAALISVEDPCGDLEDLKELIRLIYFSANELDSVVTEISDKSQLG